MSSNASILNKKLSKSTSFFGVRLWVLILFFIALIVVVVFVILFFCFIIYRRQKSYKKTHFSLQKPVACKHHGNAFSTSSLDRRLLSGNVCEIEMNAGKFSGHQLSTHTGDSSMKDLELVGEHFPAMKDVWRGNLFSFKEIELATNGLAKENVIGNGDYGVVYRGMLLDNTRVTVKRLVSNSWQTEDLLAEMDTIGHAKHKNLTKLLGYCVEGTYRMLIYEYVDNKNLHHWLHDCSGQDSPLTWRIRMNIIQGVAKGLAYLHEDVEPKILHGTLKSSNILLDHQWNPKVSDFGLAKIFGPEWCYIMMETLGYIAPGSDPSGAFTEKNDVYSFGILIMEIVSGRTPLDRRQPQEYLIDWLKSMIANQKIAYVVDSKLPEVPPSKELKRILLIALRCVDPAVNHRPTMGEVIHMLEPRDLLLCDEQRIRRNKSRHNLPQESNITAKLIDGR
ncbi:Kinase family protein [Quillaja saponaria]|uniref:non-specific serine/threonine protein kinase n=1 Tax=Quillaja saponaria TaxID=32244 RepID=A0AAD7PVZ3_QUISA|nr:Kinase family protein [Quillaja saponaria]